MLGLASTQISPGAQTCVVVGAIDESVELDLSGYRSILWFTQESATAARLAGLAPGRTQV